ncbi:MAG: serine/threonine protein kinase [Gemmataceae bacterium]|nr:serine/threonine protein kinase [Gemmataceae bacterium]
MDRPDEIGSMPTGDFSRLQELAESLEQAWKDQGEAAGGVDLGRFLPPAGDPLRLAVLHELVRTDLSIRMARGQLLSLDYYLEKYPEIGPSTRVTPGLILEEYLARRRKGYPVSLAEYQKRFPGQFEQFEKLIPDEEIPVAPKESTPFLLGMAQGKTIGGRFELQKRIGSGQFGEVWQALDTQGQIEKALKIILRPMDTEESKAELQSLEIIKRLNHPYLLRTESFWQEHDRLFIVMELADGSLRDLLKKCKKDELPGVPVLDLLRFFHNAAAALDYLHARGIVHRDIKPDNILLVDEFAKIADLGLAKLMSHGKSMTASLAGTMAYMAPEVWSERVSKHSDQYSLAVAYSELRQGKSPFKGRNLAEFFQAHKDAPDLEALPDDEQEIVLKALSKHTKDRFASCSEFVKALDAAVSHTGTALRSLRKAAVRVGPPDSEAPVGCTIAPSQREVSFAEDDSPPTERPFDTTSREQKQSPNWKEEQKATDKPGRWQTDRAEQQAEAQPAPSLAPAAKPYSRAKRNVIRGVVVTAILGIALFLAGYVAKSNLERTVKDHLNNERYIEAFEAIESSSILVLPFRDAIRENARQEGLVFAKKIHDLNLKPEKVEEICRTIRSFYDDPEALDLQEKALRKIVPAMLVKEEFAQAYARLGNLPNDSKARKEVLSQVEDAWASSASKLLADADFSNAQTRAEELLKHFESNATGDQVLMSAKSALAVLNLVRQESFSQAHKLIPARLPKKGQDLLKSEILKSLGASVARKFNTNNLEQQRLALDQMILLEPAYRELQAERKSRQQVLVKNLIAKADTESKGLQFDESIRTLTEATKYAESEDEKNALEPMRKAVKLQHRNTLVSYAQKALDDGKPAIGRGHLSRLQKELGDPEYRVGEVDVSVKTMLARVYVLGPKGTELDEALELFKEVGKKDNPNLEELCRDFLNACKDNSAKYNPSFRKAASGLLVEARRYLKPGPVYEGITALIPGSDLLKLARAAIAAKPNDALNWMRKIDAANLEQDLKKDYVQLCEELADSYLTGKKGVRFDRADLVLLESAVPLSPNVKEAFPAAMTKYIEDTAADWPWPKSKKEWDDRFQDCTKADKNNPWVWASLVEYRLQMGDLPATTAAPIKTDVPYAAYVKARVLADHKKHRDAAAIVASLDPREKWFLPERRKEAGALLQTAALSLRPKGRLYSSSEDADSAFKWLEKSVGFMGLTEKEMSEHARLGLTLAIYSIPEPDLEKAQLLAAELVRSKSIESSDSSLLRMIGADTFAGLKAWAKDEHISTSAIDLWKTRLKPALDLGREQVTKEAKNLQAARWALVGVMIQETPTLSSEIGKTAFDSFSEAVALDPTEARYLTEMVYCAPELQNPPWETLKGDIAKCLPKDDPRHSGLLAFVYWNQSATKTDKQKLDLLRQAKTEADSAQKVKDPEDATRFARDRGGIQLQLADCLFAKATPKLTSGKVSHDAKKYQPALADLNLAKSYLDEIGLSGPKDWDPANKLTLSLLDSEYYTAECHAELRQFPNALPIYESGLAIGKDSPKYAGQQLNLYIGWFYCVKEASKDNDLDRLVRLLGLKSAKEAGERIVEMADRCSKLANQVKQFKGLEGYRASALLTTGTNRILAVKIGKFDKEKNEQVLASAGLDLEECLKAGQGKEAILKVLDSAIRDFENPEILGELRQIKRRIDSK